MSERPTDNPLGQKINLVMREKGMPGDYAALAGVFDVSTPSVYDWIKYGRLGKERYAKLVEWSKRSLNWWFDIPQPSEQPVLALPGAHTIGEQQAAYIADEKPTPRRFERISSRDWQLLSDQDIAEIESFAMGYISAKKGYARAPATPNAA